VDARALAEPPRRREHLVRRRAPSNPEDLGFYELTRAGDQVRIFLHTATDHHPHALPDCLARGNRVHREEPLESPIS
jgi:hypothetical protein